MKITSSGELQNMTVHKSMRHSKRKRMETGMKADSRRGDITISASKNIEYTFVMFP